MSGTPGVGNMVIVVLGYTGGYQVPLSGFSTENPNGESSPVGPVQTKVYPPGSEVNLRCHDYLSGRGSQTPEGFR